MDYKKLDSVKFVNQPEEYVRKIEKDKYRTLEKAKDYFSKSWNYYPEYNKVQEINTLLNELTKDGKKIDNWGKEVYCPIVKEHSWGMPDLVKTQMISQGNCNQ